MNLEKIMNATPEQQSYIKEELLQMSQDQVNAAIVVIENVELKKALKQSAEDYRASTESMRNTVSTAMEEMRIETQAQNQIIQTEISSLKTSNQILEQGMSEKIVANNEKMTALCKAHDDEFKVTKARIEKATLGYVNKAKEDMKEAHRTNKLYWKVQVFKNIGMWIYLALSPALIIFEILGRKLGWF